MGETWKARRWGVPGAPVVVIKRILPALASDPSFVESFVNEAHITASLDHPNICRVLDFGRVAGEYFFAIEFVHGRSVEGLLRATLAAGLPTLPVPVGCYLAAEVLRGLHAAHARTGPKKSPATHRQRSTREPREDRGAEGMAF
jgi:serine/threonine-protein kinase